MGKKCEEIKMTVNMIGFGVNVGIVLLLLCCLGNAKPERKSNFFDTDGINGKILAGPPKRPSPYPPAYPPSYPRDPDTSGSGSGSNQQYEHHPSISSVDMQLLTAMEKLVARMDKLDARVKTLENVVYYITNKQKPEQGNCPKNYTQVEGIKGKCYYFSSFQKPSSVYDWQSASTECAKIGARLVEMIKFDDFHRLAQFLVKFGVTDRQAPATDFWTGGLNPGLIWLWSESGQQVEVDRRFWNDNDNSSKAPGCLKLSYSHRLNAYFFKGAPCTQTQNFVCEISNNYASRALARFEQELTVEHGSESPE